MDETVSTTQAVKADTYQESQKPALKTKLSLRVNVCLFAPCDLQVTS